MALNPFARVDASPLSPPVTLPKFRLADIDVESEAREGAAKVAERKIIRAGIDAWSAINKAESFEGWLAIGRALQIGRTVAMRASGSNCPNGPAYTLALRDWLHEHHFSKMTKQERYVAIELSDHIEEITAWRDTLPKRKRERLIRPCANVRQ
jgi:hypothetical protein